MIEEVVCFAPSEMPDILRIQMELRDILLDCFISLQHIWQYTNAQVYLQSQTLISLHKSVNKIY